MSKIIVNNGIMRKECPTYSIYEMTTPDKNNYFMCLPIESQQEYQMVVDFPEEYYKSLRVKDIFLEIEKICNKLYSYNESCIYILPNVTTYDVAEAKQENDDHAYHNLLRNLQKYTYSAFESLKQNENLNINSIITLISQTTNDKRFSDWLELNMPGYFKMLDFNKLQNTGISRISDMVNEETNDMTVKYESTKVRKLIKPQNNNPKGGYTTLTFIITVLTLSIFFGLFIAFLCLK